MKKLLLILFVFNGVILAMERPPKRGLKRIARDIEREEYEMAQCLCRMEGSVPAPVRAMPSNDVELPKSTSEKHDLLIPTVAPTAQSATELLEK